MVVAVIRGRALVALGALATAWLVMPAAVPIYDGIGNPDEPYRWVVPPATAKSTPPPTSASLTLPVRNGHNTGGGFANSSENGPQFSLNVLAGAIEAPDATSVRIAAVPLGPSPPLPDDGAIVTNVYRITMTTDGRDASLVNNGDLAP